MCYPGVSHAGDPACHRPQGKRPNILFVFTDLPVDWRKEKRDLDTDPDKLSNLYGRNEYSQLTFELNQQLTVLQIHYENNTDVSEKPDTWKAKMRGAR